jgi:hypothetical protein
VVAPIVLAGNADNDRAYRRSQQREVPPVTLIFERRKIELGDRRRKKAAEARLRRVMMPERSKSIV